MDLQRADAGREVDDAGDRRLAQRVAQGLHAQAQFEIQFLLAEFDENVLIARAADDDILRRSQDRGFSIRATKRTLSPGLSWPIFHRSAFVTTAGQTKPPSEGPSGPSRIGMSPVKSMAPTA